MDETAVLEQCAANPDDDGPRLVWADLVGGERGELVVLQCDLARGELSPREAATRRRRERELLERNGVAWASELATMATRWTFRRGFIETAEIHLGSFDTRAFAEHPLLATIGVDAWNIGARLSELLAARPLRGLALRGPQPAPDDRVIGRLASAKHARGLRAFAVDDLQPSEWIALRDLLVAAPIEVLHLHEHALEATQIDTIVQAATLAALELVGNAYNFTPAIAALRRPLRALRTTKLTFEDLELLANHSSTTLEHLRCDFEGDVDSAVLALGAFTRLRTLDIGGALGLAAGTLALSPGFDQLRVLRIHDALSAYALNQLVERFGKQLELVEVPFGAEIEDITRARVAGELHTENLIERFGRLALHPSPAAMFTLAPACFPKSQPACLARLDKERTIWDIPALPIDERVLIGRGLDNMVRLHSPMIARRHAMLTWSLDHHVLHDLGSTNGTWVESMRVESTELADGTVFRIGDVSFQYFVGDGARQRAEAIVQSVGGT